MSSDTPTLLERPPLEEARPVHARWSELNGEFLDFVAENPEYLERETFASIHEPRWLRKLDLQPWPIFLGAEQRREVERMTLGMDRLVKGVVERFLANDPARILEFYHAKYLNRNLLDITLRDPLGIAGAPSRADLVENGEGLKYLEYNAGSGLGGMQTGALGELYLACPPIARFLEAKGRRAHASDTVGALFRHLVEETARIGVWKGGEFNAAIVTRPHDDAQIDLQPAEMYDRALRRVLEERGTTGQAFACGPEDFVEERGALTVAGRRIHVLVEHHDGSVFLRIPYLLSKLGRVNFISGPIGVLLSDKRNLALISEHALSDELTGEERALVERHLPWTRRVRPVHTTFRGRGFRLPDDLADHRAEMVLKKAMSLGGRNVLVGRYRTDAEWRDDVAHAVQDGGWIVQEYVETVPYCFQRGERGAARHDMVWGLFAFGNHFGGAFLRMQGHGGGTGVVNTHQGAECGVALELDD
jgi:hypothetical protein